MKTLKAPLTNKEAYSTLQAMIAITPLTQKELDAAHMAIDALRYNEFMGVTILGFEKEMPVIECPNWKGHNSAVKWSVEIRKDPSAVSSEKEKRHDPKHKPTAKDLR